MFNINKYCSCFIQCFIPFFIVNMRWLCIFVQEILRKTWRKYTLLNSNKLRCLIQIFRFPQVTRGLAKIYCSSFRRRNLLKKMKTYCNFYGHYFDLVLRSINWLGVKWSMGIEQTFSHQIKRFPIILILIL